MAHHARYPRLVSPALPAALAQAAHIKSGKRLTRLLDRASAKGLLRTVADFLAIVEPHYAHQATIDPEVFAR